MKKKLKKLCMLCFFITCIFQPQQGFAMNISSECGILMEQITGRVLFEKCADQQLYIASITKILTALIAIENGELNEWVEVTDDFVRQVGSSLYLTIGDEMKLMDLIYGLLLRSGNDAALAIAEFVGGDEATFIDMMNERAREIGMENSIFQNPSGLDETTYNLSTAKDMAIAMQFAMNNPVFREIAGTKTHRATSKDGKTYVWTNKHKLVTGYYEPAIGGKTGFTKQARRTLVTSALRDGMELVVVTLKAGDDWHDHMQLFEHGFNQYEVQKVVEVGELQLSSEQLEAYDLKERLYVNTTVYLTVRQDGSETVRTNLKIHDNQTEDGEVGILQILLNDEIQDELPVYQVEPLEPSKSWIERLFSWFTGMVSSK